MTTPTRDKANPWTITTRPVMLGLFGYRWVAADARQSFRAKGWALTDQLAQHDAWEALSEHLVKTYRRNA